MKMKLSGWARLWIIPASAALLSACPLTEDQNNLNRMTDACLGFVVSTDLDASDIARVTNPRVRGAIEDMRKRCTYLLESRRVDFKHDP